jgi:tRNA (guanine37-N1)-methyltransferase
MIKNFHLVSIFPTIFESYLGESILKRAQKEKRIAVFNYDLRRWTKDKHRTTDDTPYGGGAGMVMKVEPFFLCVKEIKASIKKNKKGARARSVRTVLFSAKGKSFTQREAERLSRYDDLIFLCGRYEGVDERVAENVADEELSIGNYVLTGGELPALVVLDAVSRLLEGVLKNAESSKQESHSQNGYLEYPQYTKPEIFRKWSVPKILLSGDHKKIKKWREEKAHNSSYPET